MSVLLSSDLRRRDAISLLKGFAEMRLIVKTNLMRDFSTALSCLLSNLLRC